MFPFTRTAWEVTLKDGTNIVLMDKVMLAAYLKENEHSHFRPVQVQRWVKTPRPDNRSRIREFFWRKKKVEEVKNESE